MASAEMLPCEKEYSQRQYKLIKGDFAKGMNFCKQMQMKVFCACLLTFAVGMATAIDTAKILPCEERFFKSSEKQFASNLAKGKSYCKQIEDSMDVQLGFRNCSGKMIGLSRCWTLVSVILNEKMRRCEQPKLKIDDLHALVKLDSPDYYHRLKQFRSIEHDVPQPCAKEINMDCIQKYEKDMKNGMNICRAIEDCNKCIDKGLEICDAKILWDYVFFAKSIANDFLPALKENNLCMK